MHRRQVLLGMVGLALAATTVRADVPKIGAVVKIFDQPYKVADVRSRAGAFKNGVTVSLTKPAPGDAPDTVTAKANLCFVQGADAAADRLFVAAPFADVDGVTGDQLYLLTGTDANGVFSTAASNATVFFSGDRNAGGRPNSVIWLNDTQTGPKKDRNLIVTTFTGTDFMRWYDLDTLNATKDNAFRELPIFELVKPAQGTGANVAPDPDTPDIDDNMPYEGYYPGALTPGGMLVIVGSSNGDLGLEVGVIDPVKGTKFFPVKTNIAEVTQNSTLKIEEGQHRPNAFLRMGADEYWMIASTPDPAGALTSADAQFLYRLRLTLPADLTKAAPNGIKVEILGKEDMLKLGLHASDQGIFGMTAGREVAPGKRIVYMADWQGNLITLRPDVPATAGQ